MDKEAIFIVIKNKITDTLQDVNPEDIKLEGTLADLGANSVDRLEILTSVLQELKVKIPLLTLGKTKQLDNLVDLLYQEVNHA